MRHFGNRLRLLTLIVFVAAGILVIRLYWIQIFMGDRLSAKAEGQYIASTHYFDRGSIFFTAKEGSLVPAASIGSGFTLYINPRLLKQEKNLESVFEKINAIAPIDKEDFLTKADTDSAYRELAKRLSLEIAETIRLLKIPGISVERDRWRFYPGENMAAHAIGLIGYQGDNLAGRYGLERFYEQTLVRESDEAFVNFFAEIFANLSRAVKSDKSLEGDIVTTMEPSVQAFLESELVKVTNKYSSEFTGGIIIDPMSGEIAAMALTPAFDPNFPQNEKDSKIFSDPLIEDRYEMGSIIKALSFAVGLDSGAITAKTTYNDPGCMTLNAKTFCNYDGKSHGSNVSMQTVLNKSLNTGATFITQKMGAKNFNERLLKFGFENLTGIDLPNEGKSLVSNLKTGRELEAAQASFGQGIALTPIATVRALSALANGGILVTPHLVKAIKYKLGPTKNISYPSAEERERVISPEASTEISRMLTEVVDRSLRNGQVRLEHYSVAAKTGTAQIARSDVAGYYDDRFLHSFFGYFPAYEPRYLVFLYTYYPKGVQFASETLTDSFINLTKFIINYYNIAPDRESAPAAPR
ncbi:MAG: penicillin-binding protein 2 [Candidatus Zambryskibacteria bacterium]|nr:penicillin-binding protein 2 [Candidatus Zambryskibacteria bacterium]